MAKISQLHYYDAKEQVSLVDVLNSKASPAAKAEATVVRADGKVIVIKYDLYNTKNGVQYLADAPDVITNSELISEVANKIKALI